MKEVKNNSSTYVLLGPFTSAIYGVALVFAILAFILNIQITNASLVASLVALLSIVGLIYNLLIYKQISKKTEIIAKYLQVFFALAILGVVAFFSGGVNSVWYILLLFLIIIASVLGYKALYVNLFLLTLFLGGDIAFNLLGNPDSSFEFRVFPITIAALACAWLVAYSIESGDKSRATIEKFGTHLNNVELSERALLAAISDPMISLDATLKIMLMNQPAQALTGWDVSEAVGLSYSQVLGLKDETDQPVTAANDPFIAVINSKQPLQTEDFHIIRKKDSSKIPLEISISPTFSPTGEITAEIIILRDISKKQALDRERSEFISTASHEMRTPVAAIEGYIAMATNPKIATIDTRAKGFLDKAHDSAIHLGKLFQDLLSITKIEDKNYRADKVLFNLSDLVLKTATEFQPLASEKGLSLTTHIGGSSLDNERVVVPAFPVFANPERIKEVLGNLIDNAIKYSDKGSVEISMKSEPSAITVSVADNGMGISKQEQKHIFEKFYRVNDEMTRTQPGTGLGLFIARNLIELNGGTIWVESEPGKGSIFSFKLPVVKKVAK